MNEAPIKFVFKEIHVLKRHLKPCSGVHIGSHLPALQQQHPLVEQGWIPVFPPAGKSLIKGTAENIGSGLILGRKALVRRSLSNSTGGTFNTAGPCTSSPSPINSRWKKQYASSLSGLSPPKNSKQQILIIGQTSGFLLASINHQLHQCMALTSPSRTINFKADRAQCVALWAAYLHESY